MRKSAGFTLIELLVSIALMAMMLTALLSFVFSMSEIWGGSGEKRLFDQHVNAVTQHLEAMFRHAALPTAGPANDEPFSFKEIRSQTSGPFTGLTFTLVDGDRLLKWADHPAPLAECTLDVVSGQGLVLFWRSLLEEHKDDRREKLVTPFVTSLTFNYYDSDSKSWRSEPRAQKNSENLWRVPEQIVLHYEHSGLKADRTITLPLAPGGQPIF